jgi:TonB family protein
MWALAVLAALAIHVAGFAVAREYLRDDDPDPELGAPALAIGVELASPRVDPSDLPPGPEVEQSPIAVAAVQPTKILEETVLPKEPPVETEQPDLLVAPMEAKEVKEDQPVTPTMPALPAEASIAVEATAIPSSQVASESPRSITPEQGTGESPQRVRATWQKELVAHLDRHKRYPASSTRSAEVLVNFVIDESGHIISSRIVRGAGDAAFDEAALAMLERSDPVPKPPPLVVQQGLNFTQRVIFRVKHVN